MPILENLDAGQLAALDVFLESEGIAAAPPRAIERSVGPARISAAQRRLWFLNQLDPASPAYNIATAVRLHGHFEPALLAACFDEIICRHEVLRTTFHRTSEGPQLCLHDHADLAVSNLDVSQLPASERESSVRAFIAAQAEIPFNLANGPLLRVGIARLGAKEHVVVLVMHHIVSDGWSMGVLVRELSELYAAFRAGLPSPLRPLPIQYADYAEWQQGHREQFETQLKYWRKQLADAPQLALLTDRPRPTQPSFAGAVEPVHVGRTSLNALRTLAQSEGATLFTALVAVFQVLLSRYTQQTDIVVGVPSAGREHEEFFPLIGFFVNSLALRTRWPPSASFREVLRHTRVAVLQALQNQDVPFDEVVRAVLPGRDLSHNPLFQVMFNVDMGIEGVLTITEAVATAESVKTGTAKFDLVLHLTPSWDGLCGGFEYSTDLFERATLARMAGHFQTLLESIVRDPDQSVATLPILGEAERRQILVEWNQTNSAFPRDKCVHELFEEQARRQPGKVAVVFGDRQLTYAELNGRANRLAHYLASCGVRPGTLVGLFAERSIEMVVGMLGILKAGAAYVPLDTAYPKQRLALMLEDCRARVLLTQEHVRGLLPHGDLQIVCLDADWQTIGQHGTHDPGISAAAEQLAYVIYTSGSTGVPKGVAVPHAAINRLVLQTDYISLQPSDVVAQASNASFDAATFEIWGSLLNGARLVGIEREVTLAPDRFGAVLRDAHITTLFLTTALFNQMAREAPGAFGGLRHLLFGGELVDPDCVRRVLQDGPPERLLHVYGPTENTTFSTWYLVREVAADALTVPIGKAIANTQLYVLDDRRQLVPVGIPGELFLGGDGLATGYLHRPELTAERFVDNPFDAGRSRLYRTGDIVRWLPGGNIEFLGRRDNQVKIRGFRIELGEIEAALVSHAAIREAVVTSRKESAGKQYLVAYVTPASTTRPVPEELRSYLDAKLPAYMMPAYFVGTGQVAAERQRKSRPPRLTRAAGDVTQTGSCCGATPK